MSAAGKTPASSSSAPGRRRMLLPAFVIVAVTLVAYANSFTDQFVGLDARESIRDNPYIRRLWPLTDAMSFPLLATTEAADEGSKGGTVVRRPILSLSFALNYQLSGLDPRGFHAVNLAIHLGCALLLFGIVRRTLTLAPYRERYGGDVPMLAAAIALIWAVHPVQTESVTYIVQRAEAQMALFFLSTLYCSLRAFGVDEAKQRGSAGWYAGAITSAALGMGTKEVAAVAPIIVLLYDAVFLSGGVRPALARRRRFYAALAATWLVVVGLVLATLSDVQSDFTEGRNLSYALAQPRILFHYLRVALWPHPLHVYVNTELFDALPVLTIAVCTGLLALVVAAAAWALYRGHWLGFAGAWFFGILAPSSSVVAVSDVIQEHRIYLSLAAVVTLAVVAADLVLRRLVAPRAGRRAQALAATLLAGSVVLAFTVLTHARNRDYHREFTMIHPADLPEAYTILADHYVLGEGDLDRARSEARATLDAEDAHRTDRAFAHYLLGLAAEKELEPIEAEHHFAQAVRAQPDFAAAHNKLGLALLHQGKHDAAAAQFERTVAAWPKYAGAQLNLGRARLGQGRLPEARAQFEKAINLDPTAAVAYNNIAFVLEQQGDVEGAVAYYEKALAVDPRLAIAHNNLGDLRLRNGDLDRARPHFERALAVHPGDPFAHGKLSQVLEAQGDLASAATHLRQSLMAGPPNASARIRLGTILEQQGDPDGAKAQYEQALADSPALTPARTALATLLARQGLFAAATPHFEKVLRMEPDNVPARSNLGVLMARQGRLEEAKSHLERVLRVDSGFHLANFNLALVFDEQGDLSRAREHYESEIRANPDFAPAHGNLAYVLERQGDRDAATRHYQRALELAPDLTAAREGLARLRASAAGQ